MINDSSHFIFAYTHTPVMDKYSILSVSVQINRYIRMYDVCTCVCECECVCMYACMYV